MRKEGQFYKKDGSNNSQCFPDSDTFIMKFVESGLQNQNSFINEDILKNINIELHNYEYFFDIIRLDESTKREFQVILTEMINLPAALSGYHGDYPGGLFDHTLLVVNFAFYLWNSLKDNLKLEKVILSSLCHDFGKIPYYRYKLGIKDYKIEISNKETEAVQKQLNSKFQTSGKDWHIENSIAIIRKYISCYKSLFNNEMFQAIMVHHGGWTRYSPIIMNELGALIHCADMMASQVLNI